MSGSLEAIKYERGRMQLLDQRKLPLEFTYLDVNNTGDAWWMIRDMVVRGAPAIAVSGCLSLAVELVKGGSGSQFKSNQEARDYVFEKLDHLVTSRPTAVNLADAAKKLKLEVDEKGMVADAPNGSVVDLVVRWCEEYLEEDIAACKAMGEHGSKAMVEAAVKRGRAATGKLKVLTHCNTGSLATAGFGSALGVIRALHATGLLEHAYCTETRPYGQGARLTAFELVFDKIPATLITDSMAAALMQQGDVDAVVVGADRIAANGDTANKIGTYMLAIVAAHHNVPMFTAASTSTMDPTLPHGSLIPIEQRSGEELTHFRGQRVVVEGIGTWNPAFDVAPAAMLEGIITEHGLVPKQLDGSFAVRDFLLQHGLLRGGQPREAGGASLITAPGFKALDETTVREYVADRPLLCSRVGDAGGKDGWDVVEVGDGNINFVYILKGPAGGLCVKQGLPYVRCVGESWPLTQERMRYEADALRAQHRECPQHTPEVYLFDERMSLVAMEYIAEPAVVARTGLVAGAIYPKLASQLAEFMSCTLFNTSLLRLDSREFAKRCARFANTEMCRLTEQVIFTEPYMHADNNRWTSPELDDAVAALRTDTPAKLAAARAKALFMNRREALCHGDLHLGSLMVAADSMAVIDAEFAFYGPIAFDVGKMLGNLLLAFFAADGHAAPGSPRDAQSSWLISCLTDTWTMFRSRFTQLWSHHASQPGDLYHPVLYGSSGSSTLAAAQQDYMDALFQECLLMAGAVMIRRLVGIAHVKEMDAIPERSKRASCERQGLAFGRRLLVEGSSFASIDAVAAAALLHRDASQ